MVECLSVEFVGVSDGGVSFSKVISFQFSDCNIAIKRIHHRFFLGNVPKTSCLKKFIFFLRKKSLVDQSRNKAVALQYTTLNFIKNSEPMRDLSVEALKVLMSSQVSNLGGGFFHWSCRSRVYPSNFIKNVHHRAFSTWVLRGSSFKLSRNFLLDTFAKHFLTKLQTSNL